MLEHFRDLQLRPQSQRLQILQLLNDLMYGHRPALKSLESESLVGIIDLVSGEKDPRNLMIIFSILKVVMVEWDITGHAEVSKHRYMFGRLLKCARLFSIPFSAIFQLHFDRRQMILMVLLPRILRIV